MIRHITGTCQIDYIVLIYFCKYLINYMTFVCIFIYRSFDLYVNGGTPYEKGVEVDPSISRRSKYIHIKSGAKWIQKVAEGILKLGAGQNDRVCGKEESV